MSKNLKIPTLRFKEFSGEWEEKKLGNVSNNVMYGMNSSAIKYDGLHKYIRITDIDESSRQFLPNPVTSPDGEIEDKFKLKDGDILFTRTGASVGKSYLYNKKDGNLYFAGFLIKFNINDAVPYFIFLLTLRDRYNQWVSIMSMRSGQPGINAEEYKLLSINLPQKQEQEKIASFLSSIDKKIEQLSKKDELLHSYKKGTMQKIFSQEIRFYPKGTSSQAQGETDDGSDYPDWEEKKLGELCKVVKSGGTPTSTNKSYYDGNIPFLAISDITTQGKYLTYTSKTVSQKGIENSASWIVPKNTIIYSMYASVGFVSINKIPLATSQAVINLILKDSINTEYIYYYLLDYKKYIHRYIETGTQGNLNAQSVKSLKINLPCLEEQTKIANFLSSIDTKISQNRKALEETKKFKKALLQQMFV